MGQTKIKSIFLLLIFMSTAMSPLYSNAKDATNQEGTEINIHSISDSERRQFTYFFYEAIRQRELQNFDVAFELLMKCYYIDNNDANLMYELANIYVHVGQINLAIFYLTEAVRLDPGNFWYQKNLANLFLAVGDHATAASVFEFAAENFPYRSEINHSLFRLYLQERRFQDALNILNRIEAKEGISDEVSFEKFRILFNLGRRREAFREIDALIRAFPQEMRFRVFRGSIYLEENNYRRALSQFRYVLRREPDNAAARFAMATYYERRGQSERAIAQIHHVLRSASVDVETKIGVLIEYLEIIQDNDDWADRTAEMIEILLEKHYGVASVHFYYALFLVTQERYEEAASEFETVLSINHLHLESWHGLIEVKIIQEKMEDIARIAGDAVEIFPNIPLLHLYKAIAHQQLRNFEEALSALKAGLPHIPEADTRMKSDFHGVFGDIYFELGEGETTFEHYEKALRYNSANTHVLNNFAYHLATQRRDLQRAEAMIRKCLSLTTPVAATLNTLARVLFMQGHFYLSRRYVERSIQLGGYDIYVIVEYYGDVLFKTGDIDRAVEMWKKSLELGNPSETLILKIEQRKYIE